MECMSHKISAYITFHHVTNSHYIFTSTLRAVCHLKKIIINSNVKWKINITLVQKKARVKQNTCFSVLTFLSSSYIIVVMKPKDLRS